MKLSVISVFIFALEGHLLRHRLALPPAHQAPPHRRPDAAAARARRSLIFDSKVPGMDATAAIVFIKVARLVRSRGMTPVDRHLAQLMRARLEGSR